MVSVHVGSKQGEGVTGRWQEEREGMREEISEVVREIERARER